VLVGLIVVMTRILKGIPPYSAQVQDFFLRVRDGVRKTTDKTASVVIALQSAAAAARRVVKRE
jgi:hypothetical protein